MATVNFLYTSKELTARERIKLKDRSDAVNLWEAVDRSEAGFLEIYPELYAALEITGLDETNEDGEEKVINTYMFIDKNGTKYAFSSKALWEVYLNIKAEMGEEEFGIRCFKKQSKQNAAYRYLTCAII